MPKTDIAEAPKAPSEGVEAEASKSHPPFTSSTPSEGSSAIEEPAVPEPAAIEEPSATAKLEVLELSARGGNGTNART